MRGGLGVGFKPPAAGTPPTPLAKVDFWRKLTIYPPPPRKIFPHMYGRPVRGIVYFQPTRSNFRGFYDKNRFSEREDGLTTGARVGVKRYGSQVPLNPFALYYSDYYYDEGAKTF